ncbi:MAG: hypothetical protein DRJ55_02825 [Thermoprotei archaeon]|nr:MAG: hypothetical protein DRJ55_02825 [Thermoprotei archaeon]HDJ97116.1 DUF131 domain-containing protein [Thermofilum sp.]
MWSLGLLIIFAGFLMIFVGILLMLILALKDKNKGETKTGFVFFIGPFPIIGASDKETMRLALYFTLIAAALFILAVLLPLLLR